MTVLHCSCSLQRGICCGRCSLTLCPKKTTAQFTCALTRTRVCARDLPIQPAQYIQCPCKLLIVARQRHQLCVHKRRDRETTHRNKKKRKKIPGRGWYHLWRPQTTRQTLTHPKIRRRFGHSTQYEYKTPAEIRPQES